MWKDIPGYEGLYQASDMGEIKSIRRWVNNGQPSGRYVEEKILKPVLSGRGYEQVMLRKNGKSVHQYVHRLVALTFLANPSNKKAINHKDGNKRNNSVNNLEFVSYSENNYHAYANGLKGKGELFYNSKLSSENVMFIRNTYPKLNYNQLAKLFNVSRATIRDVVLNKTWKN